jgi:DNA-binding CsgD family transcriptional regulator
MTRFAGPDRIGAAETAFERNDIFNSLSDLKRQILQQTSEGFASEAIAKSLNVTPAMIWSRTRTIRQKLDAKTLSHAAAFWATHNIAD